VPPAVCCIELPVSWSVDMKAIFALELTAGDAHSPERHLAALVRSEMTLSAGKFLDGWSSTSRDVCRQDRVTTRPTRLICPGDDSYQSRGSGKGVPYPMRSVGGVLISSPFLRP